MKVQEAVKLFGVDSLLFLVPMLPLKEFLGISFTSSNDTESVVPCIINEERYKLSANHKITLKSVYKEFGKEHYYISDLDSLIESGSIRMFINSNDLTIDKSNECEEHFISCKHWSDSPFGCTNCFKRYQRTDE
jgi:hypothetical protein